VENKVALLDFLRILKSKGSAVYWNVIPDMLRAKVELAKGSLGKGSARGTSYLVWLMSVILK
jgi:hypothetical protein